MSNGLSRDWLVERIDSVFTDPNGSVFYFIKFKGQSNLEQMPAEKVMRIIPDMVIEFYMDRLSSCPKSKPTRKRKAEEE
nr:heterochromatin protein 1 [Drosophila suzukii]